MSENENENETETDNIRPPTPLARRFVRMVVGFGVGVAVGLAPFLGKVEVPGFQALLTLYPHSLREPLITLAAFLMGIIAVAVQFYAGERISRSGLRRRFGQGLAVLAVGLVATIVLWVFTVDRVPTSGEAFSVITAGPRLPTCDCEGLTNVQCIQGLSAAPEALGTCWGGPAYKRAQIGFFASYLVLTGGFGLLLGLLLLQERARRAGGGSGRGRVDRPEERAKAGESGQEPAAQAPRENGPRAPGGR